MHSPQHKGVRLETVFYTAFAQATNGERLLWGRVVFLLCSTNNSF